MGLLAALRVVVLRARHDWLVVGAAAVITLLAATFLAAGLIYADAVSSAGLQRSLAAADAHSAGLQVRVAGSADILARADAAIRDEARLIFAREASSVERRGETNSWALPGQDLAAVTQLATFAFFDDLPAHASLVAGDWPGAASTGVVPVAIHAAAAEALGYAVGDELELTSRLDASRLVHARIVGTWQPKDVADRYWWDVAGDIGGSSVSASYTTWGPLIVDEAAYPSVVDAGGSGVAWRIFPDPARVVAGRLEAIASELDGLEGRLRSTIATSQVTVVTSLGDALDAASRSLVVAQMSVTVLAVQLAVLAGYALVLTAGLLIEQRRGETALLRARGAGAGQLGAAALLEALVLAVPIAIAAPLIAVAALGIFNAAGPLHEIGLTIAPRVTPLAQLVAAATAGGCALALALPSLLQGRSFVALRARRGRQARSGVVERVGLDLALLVVAAVGLWQLRQFGAPLSGAVRGRIGVDPLLVAAPAIGLLAGAVVALRVLPLVARLADIGMTHGRGLVSSLGAWQISRRPLRYAPAALLLIVTMALGVFAASYGRTWATSQADQAAYQVGTDVRVRPNDLGGGPGPIDLGAAYRALGASDVMAVRRDGSDFGGRSRGQLLLVDTARAADVVAFRADLANDPFGSMMARLAGARPTLDLPALPDASRGIAVTMTLRVQPALAPPGTPPDQAGRLSPFVAQIVVRDGDGLLHRVELGTLAPDGSPHRLAAPIAGSDATADAVPTGPLSLVALEVRSTAGDQRSVIGSIDIGTLEAEVDGSWAAVSVAPQGGWRTAAFEASGQLNATAGLADAPRGAAARMAVQIDAAQDPRRLAPVTWALQPATLADGAVTPGLLADGVALGLTTAHLGDDVPADLGYGHATARLEEDLVAFPTADPSEPILVGDLPTAALAGYLATGTVLAPNEWWLRAPDAVGLATKLRAAPYDSIEALSTPERTAALQTDPVALGILGALALGVAAAAAFAGIGFAVSTSVAARERLTEFAVLRALGLSPRQLAGWLSLENVILVAVSLVIGTGLGLLIAWVVLPFVTLTQAGSAPLPGLVITIPWGQVLLLESVALGALAVTVAILALVLRRVGLGSALRIGED
jgi:hypothetical protein